MLWVPVRLQALPYTNGHQAWIRNIQLVDGSSDDHAVGRAVSNVSYSSLLAPLFFSAVPLASKPVGPPFTDSFHLPALTPRSPAGAQRGRVPCLVCEDCLVLLLGSEIGISL